VTTTWWDSAALGALAEGDEAAVIELEDASAVCSFEIARVAAYVLVLQEPNDRLRTSYLARWREIETTVRFDPIDTRIVDVAVEHAGGWQQLAADRALELAGAQRSDAQRIVSVDPDLLVAAQAHGFRVAHIPPPS
jgi:hypothetical protein